MKKLFCIALALLTCLSCLTACGGTEEQKPAAEPSPRPSDTETEVQDETKEITVDITEFSGTAATRLQDVHITVTVCEEYKEILGETVNVVLPAPYDSPVFPGDTVHVKIDRILNTEPLTVYASDFDAGIVDEDVDADIIPDLSTVTIMQHVPDDIFDEGIEYEEITYSIRMFRVYDIQEDRVYLALPKNNDLAFIVLMDTENISFKKDDFIDLNLEKWYSAKEPYHFSVGYEKDMGKITVYTREEVISYYKGTLFLKPVIYLYPEADTECSVKLNLINGGLTCTYPEHGENGWQNFIARPDGTLVFPNGREYYCLYWEGNAPFEPDFSKGFCVKGSDTAQFLTDILPIIGLSAREANEFIIYWLPVLQENSYNLISFQKEAYTSAAQLEITPTPDSLLRVYMSAMPVDAYMVIEPQTFDGFERKGFTVVEWGGSIIE